MADDTNHISARIEIDKIDEDKLKDDSDKKPLAAKKRVVAVPHYLRASTGSCHDSCKYGKPHVFKDKPWRAVRRMSAPLPKSEKTVDIQIFVDRKLKKTVGVGSLERPPSDEAPASEGTLRRSFPSSRKSLVHDSPKLIKQETRPFMKSLAHDSSKLVEQEARPFMKSLVPDSPKLVKQYARPFMKSPSQSPEVMKKAVQSPGRSSLSAISKLSKQQGVSASNPRVRSVSAGPVRPNLSAVRPSLSPDVFKVRGKPTIETKISGHPRSSSTAVRKVFTTPATTLSLKRAPKLDMKKPLDPNNVRRQASSVKKPLDPNNEKALEATTSLRSSRFKAAKSSNVRSQASAKTNGKVGNKGEVKQAYNEMAEEKTLHMIEIKEDHLPCAPISTHFIQSPSPLSPESLNSSSQENSLSLASHEVESCAGSTDSDADDSISDYKRNTRNHGVDQDPASLKLKFRRGKVVELEPGSHSPRRLRYKQRAISGDNQVANSGSRRKSYKKRVVESEKNEVDSNEVKVALKHQEMVTKDEQVLYNNVIEETASKLVEKRKSKVKALVGAFETVISLQERKPSAATK